MSEIILGIDVGGTGIKGALVDIESGEFIADRLRIPTPQPATPAAVSATVQELVKAIGYKGDRIGVGFPAIVHHGVAQSAANIDDSWIKVDIAKEFGAATNKKIFAVNDADAAGVAAMTYGIGKGEMGLVLFLTLGTGIGSALFMDGHLVPNTEFGHLHLSGMRKVVEKYAADSIRKKDELSWKTWGKRLSKYFTHLERLLSPDLILIGGGISKKFDEYAPFLKCNTPIKPALLKNQAGIIGAAFLASKDGVM